MGSGGVGVLVAVLGLGAGSACASAPSSSQRTIYEPPPPVDRLLPGPQLAGLTFDARGADLSAWVEDFEQKVHHNWILPTYHGYGGQVDFGLLVERNGTLTAIDVIASTAGKALERAAHEAFARSRLAPLPEDYDRMQLGLRVTCVYGPPPGE